MVSRISGEGLLPMISPQAEMALRSGMAASSHSLAHSRGQVVSSASAAVLSSAAWRAFTVTVASASECSPAGARTAAVTADSRWSSPSPLRAQTAISSVCAAFCTGRSHLLATRIRVPRSGHCGHYASAVSLVQSRSHRTISACSAASRVRRMPHCSMGSPLWRIPAVSIR